MQKKIKVSNLFNVSDIKTNKEKFIPLINGKNFFTENIISNGFKSPLNEWMSENTNEWVALLKGRAKLEFQDEIVLNLKAGDYFLIPAKTKHRLLFTSKKPYCCWLAIHFK
jgi:cupin 2 domain-containing protein